MAYIFPGTEGAGEEKRAWCRENIGKEGWSWSRSFERDQYHPINMYIHIEDEIDAMAFKLRWV